MTAEEQQVARDKREEINRTDEEKREEGSEKEKEVGQNDEEGRKQGRIEDKGDWEGSEEGVGSEGSVQAGCVLVHSCLHTGTL